MPELADDPPFVADTVPGGPPKSTAAADAPPDHSLVRVLTEYGKYVALFVGAGLISGSVVHFPLAPVRYAVIGGVGAAIFVVASVLADRGGKDALGVARLAGASLVLALGIGMISGSIQHFQDIPERAARLIPLGLALSIAAFIVRNDLRPKNDDLAALALWTASAVLALGLALGVLANRLETPAGGHDHGAKPAQEQEPWAADSSSATADPQPGKRGETAPHGKDNHGH